MPTPGIDQALIGKRNGAAFERLKSEYDALGDALSHRGIDIDAIKGKAAAFEVAVPSWGVGTGGTRFARFPGIGEPRNIFDKLDDCAVIQQLTGVTPRVSLHIPWDLCDDPAALKSYATTRGLGFDAMNSNTFQDSPGQALSYKFGSLSHTDAAVRRQAIEHNLDCITLRAGRRVEGADDLDRRRLELSRPEPFHSRLRALPGLGQHQSMRTSPTIGGCSPSTSSTSRPSIPPSCRTGAPTT